MKLKVQTNGFPRIRGLNLKFRVKKWLYYKFYKKPCASCGRPYLPYPYFQKLYPVMSHYPNKLHCGYCVYEMDSEEASRRQYEEEEWY